MQLVQRIRTRHARLRHPEGGAGHRRGVDPIKGVSNISENSTCLATEKQDQNTRGEGEIEISGALSIGALQMAMRTAPPGMVLAVQMPVTPTIPLTTSTARPRSPQ